MERLPTVNDLRVKECYICREEEVYNQLPSLPKRWVHPCKCTLVAHEECLLEWIQASEVNPDKPLASILKCPQCNEKYTMESKYPIVLGVMDVASATLSLSGTVVTILTLGTGVVSVATGVYIVSAGYGAFAVNQFLGPEMYNLVLGEDIEKWPLAAFFTLPMIPLSIILSHTKRFRDVAPLSTLMSLWPTVPRITENPGFLSFLGIGTRRPWRLPSIKNPANVSNIASDLVRDLLFSWPPSPLAFNIGLGVVRFAYGRCLERIRLRILGEPKKPVSGEARGGFIERFQVEMHIQNAEDQQEEENAEAPQEMQVHQGAPAPVNNQADQLQDDNNVRLVLDGAEEVPAAAAEPAPEAAPVPVQEQQPVEVLNPNRPAPGLPGLAGRARQANPAPNAAQNQGERDAARVRLRLTGTFLGNLIGGALIIPVISSLSGHLLLRLALPSGPNAHARPNFNGYSPFSPRRLLYRFLGIRPPGSAPNYPLTGLYAFREDMPVGQLTRALVLLSTRAMLVGTPAWTDSDPVWWRNAVGIGLFYVAKDLVTIWYQYLSQREISSRQLKDRAFEGINPKELDLKPGVLDELEQPEIRIYQ